MATCSDRYPGTTRCTTLSLILVHTWCCGSLVCLNVALAGQLLSEAFKKIQYKIELLQYKAQVEGLSFCFALIPPQVPFKVYLASPKLLDPLQSSAAMQSISCFRGARGSTSGWKWIRKSVDEGATVHERLVRQTNRKGTLG